MVTSQSFVQAQAQVCLLWSLSRLSFAPPFLRQLMTASSVADFSGRIRLFKRWIWRDTSNGIFLFIIKLTNQMSNIESSFYIFGDLIRTKKRFDWTFISPSCRELDRKHGNCCPFNDLTGRWDDETHPSHQEYGSHERSIDSGLAFTSLLQSWWIPYWYSRHA